MPLSIAGGCSASNTGAVLARSTTSDVNYAFVTASTPVLIHKEIHFSLPIRLVLPLREASNMQLAAKPCRQATAPRTEGCRVLRDLCRAEVRNAGEDFAFGSASAYVIGR